MEQKKRYHDRDDAQRNVRRKSRPDDTKFGDPQPPVIKIEDSPPLTSTEVRAEVRAEPAGTTIVLSMATEHQLPILGTITSPQPAVPPPRILPTPHFSPPIAPLEDVRKRLLEHEIHFRQVSDKAWTPEEADRLDRDEGSKYVAFQQQQNNWCPPELPTYRKYGKDTPHPPPGDTPHLFGPPSYGMHESELILPKYNEGPRPITRVKLNSSRRPAHYKNHPGLGPADPRLARSPPRRDPPVEPRGQEILSVAPQRQNPLPLVPRYPPIEALIPRQRWIDTVSPEVQAQAQNQNQNQGPEQNQGLVQDQEFCQRDTKDDDDDDDESPVLLQYPVGDGYFATINVRVERHAEAAARHFLSANARRKTDYKEVTPEWLARLVAETVADEKQRLRD